MKIASKLQLPHLFPSHCHSHSLCGSATAIAHHITNTPSKRPWLQLMQFKSINIWNAFYKWIFNAALTRCEVWQIAEAASPRIDFAVLLSLLFVLIFFFFFFYWETHPHPIGLSRGFSFIAIARSNGKFLLGLRPMHQIMDNVYLLATGYARTSAYPTHTLTHTHVLAAYKNLPL